MSELKWNWVYYPYLDAPNEQKESALKAGYIKVVSKDEADKAISDLEESHKMEVEQLLMEIVELKDKLSRKTEFAIQCQMAAHTLQRKLRHHKYKRCRAMAKWCHDVWFLSRYDKSKTSVFYWRWWNIWLELADKFKEKK